MENNFNFQIISVDRLGELSEWEVESGRMVMMGGLGKCCGGCEGAGGVVDIFKCCEDILVKCSVLVLFFSEDEQFCKGCTSVLMQKCCENELYVCRQTNFQMMHQYTDVALVL